MTPLTKFSSKDIEFARVYVNKHANTLLIEEIVEELCDNAQKILKENENLKEQLFQIEQEQDPEKRWETILAVQLDRAIRENKNKDFLEISNSINNDIFIITIQRKFGQTPEQLHRQSDIRRLKAEKKIENLLNDNRQMMKKLHSLDKELRVLKAIKDGKWDDIKSRQDIEAAIEMVNYFIKQHNQTKFKNQIDKLTNSMRESMHEAWARAADISWKMVEMKKEFGALKLELNRKNIEKSKFSKYRKRERNARVVAQPRSLSRY